MAGTDFSNLTNDELINGIRSLDLPDYIRSKAYGVDVRETLAQMTEMLMQLAYNQGMDPQQAQDWAMQLAKIDDKADQSFVDSQLSAIVSGAPKGTYTDLSALRAAYPTGTDGIFLVLQNGHWYYWNEVTSSWTDGGVYQASGVADNSIKTFKTDFAFENVLNPSTTQALKVFNGDGTLGDNADGYFISDKIPTTVGMTWTLKRARVAQVIAQYDANDNLLSFVSGNGTTGSDAPFKYTPGNPNIAYFRVSFTRWLDTPETFWVVRGSVAPTVSIPYGITIPKLNLAGRLKGKKIAVIGDSITAADGTTPSYATSKITGFQEQLRKLGAEVTSLAIAGATYRRYDATISDSTHASIYTQIITSNGWDLTGYDCIIWFAGTNDVGRGANFGTIESRDSATTYGALNILIERAISDNPKAVQILLTPPQRVRTGTTHVPDLWGKLQELAGGFEQIGANYGIKTVNMLKEGGIGFGNISTTLWDSVHPNDLGHELIGKAIARNI